MRRIWVLILGLKGVRCVGASMSPWDQPISPKVNGRANSRALGNSQTNSWVVFVNILFSLNRTQSSRGRVNPGKNKFLFYLLIILYNVCVLLDALAYCYGRLTHWSLKKYASLVKRLQYFLKIAKLLSAIAISAFKVAVCHWVCDPL